MNLKGVFFLKIYANTVFIFLRRICEKTHFYVIQNFWELTKFIGIFDDVHFRHCFMTFVSVLKNRLIIYWAVLKNKVTKKKNLGFKVVTGRYMFNRTEYRRIYLF